MSHSNKREELEYKNSDRNLYKTHPEVIKKIKDFAFGFFPLIPLSNSTKNNQFHMSPHFGDEPIELHSSYDATFGFFFFLVFISKY